MTSVLNIGNEHDDLLFDDLLTQTPAKFQPLSVEVAQEVAALQNYVSLLADFDADIEDAPFASAAFDLSLQSSVHISGGSFEVSLTSPIDWRSFASQSQQYLFAETLSIPWSWLSIDHEVGTALTVYLDASTLDENAVNPLWSGVPVVAMLSGAVMPNSTCSSSSAAFADVASFSCCVSSCGLISTTTTTTTTRRPNAGWCFTGHRPPVPAQSGHTDKAGHGYCKKCFKEKFPELYQQKQEGRKKNCDSCGTLADLVGGLCRPCTRDSKCKQCGALSEHRAQVPLLCKR